MRTGVGLSLLMLLTIEGPVAADIPPPDPPPGKKFVPVVRKIEITANIPGYGFYRIWWDLGPRDNRGRPIPEPRKPGEPEPPPFKPVAHVDRLTLVPGNPVPFPHQFYAIPDTAVQKMGQTEELVRAVSAGRVPGAFGLPWEGDGTIPITDPRKEVTVLYTIRGIDPNNRLLYDLTTDDPPGTQSSGNSSDPMTPAGTAMWPVWVAGGACAVAAVLTGLWLARRGRRDGA